MFLDTSNRMATRSARRRDRIWAGTLLALMFSAGLVAGVWLPHGRFNTSAGDAERAERDRLVEASRSGDAGVRQSAQVLYVIDGDTFWYRGEKIRIPTPDGEVTLTCAIARRRCAGTQSAMS